MSLEQALQDNTNALVALTSALSKGSLPPAEAHTPERAAKGAKASKTAELPKAEVTEIRLETLVPQFQALITEKGRDKAVALLSKFGAVGLSKVPADKYAEFSAALAEARL